MIPHLYTEDDQVDRKRFVFKNIYYKNNKFYLTVSFIQNPNLSGKNPAQSSSSGTSIRESSKTASTCSSFSCQVIPSQTASPTASHEKTSAPTRGPCTSSTCIADASKPGLSQTSDITLLKDPYQPKSNSFVFPQRRLGFQNRSLQAA